MITGARVDALHYLHSTSRSANLSQRPRVAGLRRDRASALKWTSAAPSSFFGRRRCCSLRPKDPDCAGDGQFLHPTAASVPRGAWSDLEARPHRLRPWSLPRFTPNRMRLNMAEICLYAAAQCLGNRRIFMFLLLFREFDTVLRTGATTPRLWTGGSPPDDAAEATPVMPQFNDVELLAPKARCAVN